MQFFFLSSTSYISCDMNANALHVYHLYIIIGECKYCFYLSKGLLFLPEFRKLIIHNLFFFILFQKRSKVVFFIILCRVISYPILCKCI